MTFEAIKDTSQGVAITCLTAKGCLLEALLVGVDGSVWRSPVVHKPLDSTKGNIMC